MSAYLQENINEAVSLLEEAYSEQDWDLVEEAIYLLQAQDVGLPEYFDRDY